MKKVAELIRRLTRAFLDALNVDADDKREVARLRAEVERLKVELTEAHGDDPDLKAALDEAETALHTAVAAGVPTVSEVAAVSNTEPAVAETPPPAAAPEVVSEAPPAAE